MTAPASEPTWDGLIHPAFLSMKLNPIGNDLINHRQGHIIREEIGLRLIFSEMICGNDTQIRIELFDFPKHLIRKDGTLEVGSNLVRGIRNVLAENMGIQTTGLFWLDSYREQYLQPSPKDPEGLFSIEGYIEENILDDLLFGSHIDPNDMFGLPWVEFFRPQVRADYMEGYDVFRVLDAA